MKSKNLLNLFKNEGFSFFTGVPDSTLKSWLNLINKSDGTDIRNIIACNECESVAIATGYNLATGKIGVVYMQNAGFGKTINPLTSLTDPEVYSIPILLMIGWRGEPGQNDQPQHIKIGRIMIPMLETLGIPYSILPQDIDEIRSILKRAKIHFKEKSAPYAIIIKRNFFEQDKRETIQKTTYNMTREEALQIILQTIDDDITVFSTTGKTSRELFELRVTRGEKPYDFYTIGSMGCSPSIALGFALNSKLKTIVIDGDGALIMQMGVMATIGHYKPTNFYHILIDNNSYDSTGGQPTVSNTVNFEQVCISNGYNSAKTVETKEELINGLNEIFLSNGPSLLIIKVKKGDRNNLGRPTSTPLQNKANFIHHYNKLKEDK